MKILCIHNYYKNTAGEDIMFDKIISGLGKLNYELILYTSKSHKSLFLNILKKILKEILFVDLIKIFLIIKKNKDIKYCYVQNLFPLFNTKIVNILYKKKIIVFFRISNYRSVCPNALMFTNNKICKKCINNNIFNVIKDNCEKNLLLSIYSYFRTLKLQNLLTNENSRIIVQSKFQFNFYKNIKILNEKNIFILRNFIELEEKDVKLNLPFRNYFLLSGRNHITKGFKDIINFFINNSNLNLIVTSTNEEKFKEVKNIKFIGFLPRDKNLFLIKNCNALIFNSKWLDISPNILLEAMINKKIIISNNVESLSELLIPNVTYIPFNDRLTLGNALLGYKQINEDMNITCNAYQLISTSYNKKKFLTNLKNLFH